MEAIKYKPLTFDGHEYIWRDTRTGRAIARYNGISYEGMIFISMGIHHGLFAAGRRNGRINVYEVTSAGDTLCHSFTL